MYTRKINLWVIIFVYHLITISHLPLKHNIQKLTLGQHTVDFLYFLTLVLLREGTMLMLMWIFFTITAWIFWWNCILPQSIHLFPKNLQIWITDNIRSLITDCWKVERLWKKSKLEAYRLLLKLEDKEILFMVLSIRSLRTITRERCLSRLCWVCYTHVIVSGKEFG